MENIARSSIPPPHRGTSKASYPWEQWFKINPDGSGNLIREGTDYHVKTRSIRYYAYDEAHRRGLDISTHLPRADQVPDRRGLIIICHGRITTT